MSHAGERTRAMNDQLATSKPRTWLSTPADELWNLPSS
jgi:hypothetical protein